MPIGPWAGTAAPGWAEAGSWAMGSVEEPPGMGVRAGQTPWCPQGPGTSRASSTCGEILLPPVNCVDESCRTLEAHISLTY